MTSIKIGAVILFAIHTVIVIMVSIWHRTTATCFVISSQRNVSITQAILKMKNASIATGTAWKCLSTTLATVYTRFSITTIINPFAIHKNKSICLAANSGGFEYIFDVFYCHSNQPYYEKSTLHFKTERNLQNINWVLMFLASLLKCFCSFFVKEKKYVADCPSKLHPKCKHQKSQWQYIFTLIYLHFYFVRS